MPPNTESSSNNGKKKKKKAKKADPVVAASTPEAPQDEGWVVSTSKYEARKEKKAAIVQAGGAITATMMVASRHYSVIIGSKGSTLEKLRSKTGVDITMPTRDSGGETITLTGTQEGIDAAKQAILELAEQGHCQLIHGNVEKVHMTISNMGLLVGKDGAHINAIRTKGKVDIQLPPKGSDSKDITLLGNPANIALAVHNIKQLMSMEYCDFTHENYTSVDIKFPGSFLGLLIGPGGERIKAIKETTKTKINIPKITAKDKDTLYFITITGPAQGVENAKLMIAGVQKDFVFAEVDFPSAKIAFLIGEKGRNITALQQKYRSGISVDDHIWDPDLRTITINGFKKDVEMVQQEILQIIDIYSIETTTFPKDRMGALIGKAGKNIVDLKARTNCHINFSDHEWDDTVRVVSVEGLTDDVKACLVEIEALKVRPERKERPPAEATETLTFPKTRAGILIGRAGSNIQALQKSTKTRINVSDLNETDKQIVIEGSTEAVAAAVAKIEELRTPPPKKNSKKEKVEVEGDANDAEEAKEEATEVAADE
jgi:rRNA processing protein Krr1/Pno1